jgi:2-deoxy-D-gluconate 3-dehydrogenase
MSLFDLSDRVAIVTGGNGGIGLGMAEGLASAGATVVLAGRNAKKGETAVRRIAQASGEAEFTEVDVTSETASIFSSIMPASISASRPIY